jgi:sister-chromatid-cohesion protein PDS5
MAACFLHFYRGQARVHLRLRATLCLIKLARVRSYDKAMSPYFGEIALVMQDPIFTVRQRMLLKLGVVLPPQRLMPRWNLLPILTAIDPELENRVAVSVL